jgi:NADH dehydrogenase
MEGQKNIVILGGGFAGVRCALDLAKAHRKLKGHRIILVDKNHYHTFTPYLYDYATTGAPANSFMIPFADIFRGKPIQFVNSEVTDISTEKKVIELKSGTLLPFEYLVIALGSVPEDYKIPGVMRYGIALKWAQDAEKIRQQAQVRYEEFVKSNPPFGSVFKIVVGGGGFTGIEFAGQLHNLMKDVARRVGHDEGRFKILIVEAADRLIPGMPEWASRTAQNRLGSFRHIEIMLQSPIAEVRREHVLLRSADRIGFNLLIWTAGVKPHPLLGKIGMSCGLKGHLLTDMTLRIPEHPNIFAVGDAAACVDPSSHKEIPALFALDAERQGALAAANIVRTLNNHKLEKYKEYRPGFVIPLRGRWGILGLGKLRIKGWPAWVFHQFIHFRYLTSILPLKEALSRID